MDIHVESLIDVVREAGKAILRIYNTEFKVDNKEDQSPLTEADRAAHEVISQRLQNMYPDIPIVSEEGKHISYETRRNWEYFWLVDPLDGTKEFVKRNGEFTVNIALIKDNYPVWGIVHVPLTTITYVGGHEGAYRIDADNKKTPIHTSLPEKENITLVESRSHPSPELDTLVLALTQKYANITRIQKGSSLKLCAVAEGIAHLYPRLAPTMEWDTAAGQAIVEAAGGKVVNLQGHRFQYNKESLRNDHFLAFGNIDACNFSIGG